MSITQLNSVGDVDYHNDSATKESDVSKSLEFRTSFIHS